jgi:hypothetical protein
MRPCTVERHRLAPERKGPVIEMDAGGLKTQSGNGVSGVMRPRARCERYALQTEKMPLQAICAPSGVCCRKPL